MADSDNTQDTGAGAESPNSKNKNKNNNNNLSALDLQRKQLDKLLANPDKPVHIPKLQSEKTLRPPREIMKNVQGSSAGAGSGEFHVYKHSRRREYERIKLMEETIAKEKAAKEYEEWKAKVDAASEEKTAKNRAKRQKKKNRARKTAGSSHTAAAAGTEGGSTGGIGRAPTTAYSDDEQSGGEDESRAKRPKVSSMPRPNEDETQDASTEAAGITIVDHD